MGRDPMTGAAGGEDATIKRRDERGQAAGIQAYGPYKSPEISRPGGAPNNDQLFGGGSQRHDGESSQSRETPVSNDNVDFSYDTYIFRH
jgi:hypothetical protein